MKILVYTAIFGNKDEAPRIIGKEGVDLRDFRFVCVTDNPNVSSPDYEVMVVKSEYSDVTKNARKVKVNGIGNMNDFDAAIWHDSSVQLHADKLNELASFSKTSMISVFHHIRYCAYLEAIACIDQKKDAPLRITAQMFRYFREGFPSNNKLHETTIMVLNAKQFYGSDLQKLWWNEILNRSRRDQLSLAYASWKTKTEIGLLAEWNVSGSNNEFSTWVGHKHQAYKHKNPLLWLNSKLIRGLCKKLLYEMRRRR